MKHIDFTKIVIHPGMEIGNITIERIDPWFSEGTPCECSMGPAEYKLLSSWDENGQCTVYECQDCIISSLTAYDSPDTFTTLEVVESISKLGVYNS